MKKSLVLLPALLLVIFAILTMMDRGDYLLEKKMWKIHQQFAETTRFSGALSKGDSENLAKKYQDLIEQYPKSGQVSQLYMQIGQIYTMNKDYEKARINYSKVLAQIPPQQDLCTKALLGIAMTYEKENNDVQALKIYRRIVKNYPLTNIGLSMPIYIANYYHRLNEEVQSQHAFKEAEGFYQRVAQENPDSSEGFYALRLLAATYMIQKKWDDAVKTMEKTLLYYSRSSYLDWKTAGSMVYSINAVSIKKLQGPDQPIAFYQMVIRMHPDYPLNKFLKEVVVSLQDLNNPNRSLLIPKI